MKKENVGYFDHYFKIALYSKLSFLTSQYVMQTCVPVAACFK